MIPEGFKTKMKLLLEEDYDSFISVIEKEEAVRGLRLNLLKSDGNTNIPFPLRPLDYVSNGYILDSTEPVGNDPLHHAGAIYMQDPGAMATAAAIDVEPHWWVADLCAAPGGKSTQIAERLTEGFLLSNELVPKRARILLGNMERMGVRRAMVTSLDTGELKRLYDSAFDLVVADAPCSGEGMFRKSSEAVRDWSEGNVTLCADRQREILDNAAKLVKPDGHLLYSTCTYSVEENEVQIADFLDRHPDFYLTDCKPEIVKRTVNGIDFSEGRLPHLNKCRRFYPHVSPGEGQFVAHLMRRDGGQPKQTILYKDQSTALNSRELTVYKKFVESFLESEPDGVVRRLGDRLVILPKGVTVPPRSVFSAGVLLGEIKGDSIIPSHHFYSAYGKLFKNRINLTRGEPELEKYLRGEEISTELCGICAVLFEGMPLGGGKASGGRLKNHYPKGLRNQ